MWCGECLWFLACQAAAQDVLAAWRPPAPLGACYLLLCPANSCPCLLQCATMQGQGHTVSSCVTVLCLQGDTGEGSCSSHCSLNTSFLFLLISKVADAAWKEQMVAVKVKKSSLGSGISPAGDVTISSFAIVIPWYTEHPD